MRTAGVVLVMSALCASFAGLAACRGVLGIEQLELVDAAPVDAAQPQKDASPSVDGGPDAPIMADALPGTDGAGNDGAPACSPGAGPSCFDCCRMSAGMTANQDLMMAIGMPGPQGSCLCGSSGACLDACGDSGCSMKMPTMGCLDCIDTALFPQGGQPSAACMLAKEACADSGACSPLLDCMQTCP